jgi:tetratricopeptide (TPR) repeat protein
MNYGLAFERIDNYKEAEKYFIMSYNMNPNYWAVNVNLAIAKAYLHENSENVETYFKKGVELGSNLPSPYYFYAKYLYDQSRTAEAINLLKQSLVLTPGYIYSRNLLGTIYQNTKQWDKLEEISQKTLEIAPGDEQAIRFLEASKLRKSETDMMEEDILKAPTAEKYLNLSLKYYNLKEFDMCIAACQKAIQLNPNFSPAYNNICSANNILGNYDAAIIAGQKAVELDPNNELAKNNLAQAIKGKDVATKANIALEQNPSVENYLNLSLSYYNLKQYAKCIEMSEKILQKEPNDAAYNNICAAYNMLSQWDKAIEAGEKGLKVNPNNQLLKNNLRASYEGAKAFK